jgi:hypothetical protein
MRISTPSADPRLLLGLAGIVLAVLGGAAVATLPPAAGAIVVALVAAGAAGCIVVQVFGCRALVSLSLYVATASVAMNAVRLTSAVTLSDLFMALAAAALLLTSPKLVLSRLQATALAGAGLIVFGGLAGSFFSTDAAGSAGALLRFSIASAGTLLLLFAWQPSRAEVEIAAWAFVVSACISAAYALLLEPPELFRDRNAGLTVHPNHLAVVSLMAMGPALAFCRRPGPVRAVAGAAVILLVAALVVSGSRAGVVGLVGLLPVFLLHARGRPVATWALAAAAGGLLLVLSGAVELPGGNAVERLLSLGDTPVAASNEGRLERLQRSVGVVEENPLFGAGFENAREAHNVFLQVWASAGVFGLVGLVLVFGSVLLPLLRSRAGSVDLVSLGLIAGFAGFVCASLFQNQLWDRYVWLVIALCAVALEAAAAPDGHEEASL